MFSMEEFLEQRAGEHDAIDNDNLETFQRDMFAAQKNIILNNVYDLLNNAAKIYEISPQDIYKE